MRLLRQKADLLQYVGAGEWKILGVGLSLAGLAFGVVPLLIFLRNHQPLVLIPAALGLALLVGGIWSVSFKKVMTFDKEASTMRVTTRSLFSGSSEEILFSRISEIAVGARVYTSASAAVARHVYFMELRLEGGRSIRIEEDGRNNDERLTLERATEIAALCGAKLSDESAQP